MRRKRSTVTIQDVAAAAGVSVSTVSRVLNDKDDVAEETYENIQRVITQLGYTSSLAAKSMRSRKTNVIGLIMPDVDNSFSIEVLRGVNQAIIQFGYDLITYTGGDSTASSWAAREQKYTSLLNGSITDGIIVVAPTASTFSTAHPLVAIDFHPGNIDFPTVIATNREGALSAMEYLTQLGHRRIGFIGGRRDLQSAVRRHQGYLDGLQRAGIPIDSELFQDGNFSMEVGYRCAQKLLRLADRPTAIFAANDESAFGVIKAAHEMGLRIPDDLSVVGFDNSPETVYFLPVGLTTVDQGLRQMGLTATEVLVKLINGEKIDQPISKVPTQLIVRGSCRAI
ncbi:MAG: LacI family DNA-binding transcriptional regulator [Anaerolineae bacterium]|nr:LacI family DNA-binding transcriptional regulator [Anaerolineae bacterium]